eukprot:scaffold374483_cov28-Attheya_sp.AAC.1
MEAMRMISEKTAWDDAEASSLLMGVRRVVGDGWGGDDVNVKGSSSLSTLSTSTSSTASSI